MDEYYDPECCAICYEKFTFPVVLNCGHTFDKVCISKQKTCPICESPITSSVVNWQLRDIIESKHKVSPNNKTFYMAMTKYKKCKSLNIIRDGLQILYTLKHDYLNVYSGTVMYFNKDDKLILVKLENGEESMLDLNLLDRIWYLPESVNTNGECLLF